jgi:methylmalonyl-CoA/ethylmalonyl-CoA epimerase
MTSASEPAGVVTSAAPTGRSDPAGTATDPAGAATDPAVVSGIGVLRIDHVGIAVPDLDAAIEFYGRIFGMRCVHVEENPEQGVREAMLAVGESPDGGRIQLLAPLTEESTIAKFLRRSGPGLQQVAYTVRDVEAAAATLRERGVRMLYEVARRGTAGSRVNFVHPKDAGGVLVELVEPAPAAH